MNCIIIDDEPLARQEMHALINEVSDLEVLGIFGSAAAATSFLKEKTADIIFLDIEMPMITGLEFASELPKDTLIIFTTAYAKYALESYDLDAIGYLLKPVEKTRLERVINKAKLYKTLLSKDTEKNTIEGNTDDFFIIKSDRRFYRINFAEIRFIEGLKDYVIIHTEHQRLITAMNLKTITSRMPEKFFLRVSKSYVVNIKFIDSFDHQNIFLSDTEIPLGDVYRKAFFRLYSGGALDM